jgi:PIN domain nuclease of toxin-antitoxin system
MRFEHAEAVRSLPSHHSDPFDRLLIAHVIVEGATFVTHDRAITNYLVPILWN